MSADGRKGFGRLVGAPARLRPARIRAWLAVPVLLAVAGCASLEQRQAGAGRGDPSLGREILLTVERSGATSLELTGALDSRYLRRRGYGSPPREIDRVLDQLAREHGIERKEGWPIRSLDVYCEVFVVPDGVDVAAVLERLKTDPRVDLAQPMNVFSTLGSVYDDPYAGLQSAPLELGVEQAHRLATGKGVRVAVIDSAVDADHPDLKGRIAIERDFVGRGRGGVAEVHGTAVAGVIASIVNNREGIVGIAPGVEIASLRACWAESEGSGEARCSSFTLAQALEGAIALGAALVNLSLAGPADPLLTRLLDAAIARGIVVVAAEPEPGDGASFPASHPAVIVARAASRAPGSAVWAANHLPAPADEILTTTPGATYAFFSGTSLAAAHLTGVIALLLERAPKLGARRIAAVLGETVDAGIGGSVNACFALEEVTDVHVCERPFETVSREHAGVSVR